MFLIPLTQVESVELVIHALRAAGGEVDCSQCPARKVCMKQCLTIADAIGRMVRDGTLPSLAPEEVRPANENPPDSPKGAPLKRIK